MTNPSQDPLDLEPTGPTQGAPEFHGYRLLRLLGEGAAGEVYLATPLTRQPFAGPGEPVALKRYKPAILQEPNERERIAREFEIGSQLSHPHLVRILDYSVADEPYLVMEYVDGLPLDQWVQQFHPIPSSLRSAIFRQLLEGLQELYEHDILHRDLKPANVIVSFEFSVKIMDYGVAWMSGSEITPTGERLTTLRNSAPEILFEEESDLRSDLYSLGTILFFLLHGEEVFASEDNKHQLPELIKNEDPQFREEEFADDPLALDLLGISRDLLAKDPEERPDGVGVLRERITQSQQERRLAEPEPLHGYVATALTGLGSDTREAIDFVASKVAEVAKGFHLYVYQPRKATDPLLHADLDPTTVYLIDRERVSRTDLLVVLANKPSFGVGQELEIASQYVRPTILVYREGVVVSRMIHGAFANVIGEVVYSSPEDLERKLKRLLSEQIGTLRTSTRSTTSAFTPVAHALREARAAAGYQSPEELAAAMHWPSRLLAALENNLVGNVGVGLLTTLAEQLGTTVSSLLTGVAPEHATAQHDSSVRNLEDFARAMNVTTADYCQLRDEYLAQVAAHGQPPVLSQDEWFERYKVLTRERFRGS